MKPLLRFGNNIIEELNQTIESHEPVHSTSRGDLFVLPNLPVAAIRLKTSLDAYLEYIKALPTKIKPASYQIIPCLEEKFQVIIYAAIACRDGKVFIANKEVTVI